MTWWILLALAGFLTLLSLRHYNLFFSLSGALLWLAIWGYHLNNPPANVAIGSFVFDLLFYVFIMMFIATIYLFFVNRGRMPSGKTRTPVEQAKYEKEYEEAKRLPSDGEEAYRQRVRRALRSKRRR